MAVAREIRAMDKGPLSGDSALRIVSCFSTEAALTSLSSRTNRFTLPAVGGGFQLAIDRPIDSAADSPSDSGASVSQLRINARVLIE